MLEWKEICLVRISLYMVIRGSLPLDFQIFARAFLCFCDNATQLSARITLNQIALHGQCLSHMELLSKKALIVCVL